MGTLAPADREIIALKFFAGLNNTEIAEATGYSPSNVGTRVGRAMKRLRSALTDGSAEGGSEATDDPAPDEEVAR